MDTSKTPGLTSRCKEEKIKSKSIEPETEMGNGKNGVRIVGKWDEGQGRWDEMKVGKDGMG